MTNAVVLRSTYDESLGDTADIPSTSAQLEVDALYERLSG